MHTLLSQKYVILDIEAIALDKNRQSVAAGRYANIHNCTRKFAALLYDGSSLVREFKPCLDWRDLTNGERFRHRLCEAKIHKLSYYPKYPAAQTCAEAVDVFLNYIQAHEVNVVYFKGGLLELDFCNDLDITMVDLEQYGIDKAPSSCEHDPLLECKNYLEQINQLDRFLREDNLRIANERTRSGDDSLSTDYQH